MKTVNSKNWKVKALGTTFLVASAAASYAGLSAITSSASEQPEQAPFVVSTATLAPTTAPETSSGGGDPVSQQSGAEAPQGAVKVAGAEYYDGQYYGDTVRAGRWGSMQVVAVIENGELVNVLIANYPHSNFRSDIINRNALPTLINESIEAQDADIDFVSRATDSSRSYVRSLDSALFDAAIGIDL